MVDSSEFSCVLTECRVFDAVNLIGPPLCHTEDFQIIHVEVVHQNLVCWLFWPRQPVSKGSEFGNRAGNRKGPCAQKSYHRCEVPFKGASEGDFYRIHGVEVEV